MQTQKTEYTTLISIRPVSIAFIFMGRKLKVLKDWVFGIFFYLYYVENTEFSTFFVGVGGGAEMMSLISDFRKCKLLIG